MTEKELDIIGEIMNISMGAGANALATLLMKTCYITTPDVQILHYDDLATLPSTDTMGVKIHYTKGVDGVNLFLLKKQDMSVIMGALMGMEMEVFEFDEMTSSAACEIMNQMMGSSATSLSQFFDTVVDISTPEAFVLAEREGLSQYFETAKDEEIICVRFVLTIRDTLETDFMVYLNESIARSLLDKVEKKTKIKF